jgi:hypothetical protein
MNDDARQNETVEYHEYDAKYQDGPPIFLFSRKKGFKFEAINSNSGKKLFYLNPSFHVFNCDFLWGR